MVSLAVLDMEPPRQSCIPSIIVNQTPHSQRCNQHSNQCNRGCRLSM